MMTKSKGCTTKALLMDYGDATDFCKSQWYCHPLVFIAYRLIIFSYYFAWLVISGIRENSAEYFIYLTNIAFISLNISMLLQMISSIWFHVRKRDASVMSWPLKVSWYFYNISFVMALIVSAIYWGALYPEVGWANDVDLDVNTHVMNALYVLLDIFIVAIPIRILHFFHTLPIAAAYLTMSVIYNFHTGKAIYPILDWKNNPQEASIYACAVVFAVIPLLHFVLYGLYRARMMLYSHLVGRSFRVQHNEPNVSSTCDIPLHHIA